MFVALVLMGVGLLKILDPSSESVMGAWGTTAAWLELGLGLLFLFPRWRKLGARLLLAVAVTYTLVVVYLAASRLPLSECGCFGAKLKLGIGAHLVVLGVLGLLACACIWCEARDVSEPESP